MLLLFIVKQLISLCSHDLKATNCVMKFLSFFFSQFYFVTVTVVYLILCDNIVIVINWWKNGPGNETKSFPVSSSSVPAENRYVM